MQDATKVVLAGTLSNVKDIESFNVDPASFPAGLCVTLGSDGLPTLLGTARMGVSRGASLSDHKKTAIARAGLKVPIRSHLKRSSGIITVTNFANLVSGTDDSVSIGGQAFTAQAGAATPGTATFQAATSNVETAQSLANQINSHAATALKVYAVAVSDTGGGDPGVLLYAVVEGLGTGHDVAVAYTDNDTNVGIVLSGLASGKLTGGSNAIGDADHLVIGAKMYINNFTGKADKFMNAISTISDGVYRSAGLTGIAEDASEVCAVLVDMQGGL